MASVSRPYNVNSAVNIISHSVRMMAVAMTSKVCKASSVTIMKTALTRRLDNCHAEQARTDFLTYFFPAADQGHPPPAESRCCFQSLALGGSISARILTKFTRLP